MNETEIGRRKLASAVLAVYNLTLAHQLENDHIEDAFAGLIYALTNEAVELVDYNGDVIIHTPTHDNVVSINKNKGEN